MKYIYHITDREVRFVISLDKKKMFATKSTVPSRVIKFLDSVLPFKTNTPLVNSKYLVLTNLAPKSLLG